MITYEDINTLKELDDEIKRDTATSIIADIEKDVEEYKCLKAILKGYIAKIVTNKELKNFFDSEEKLGRDPLMTFSIPLNIFDVKIKNCQRWIEELKKLLATKKRRR
jgi:hypothetical protein